MTNAFSASNSTPWYKEVTRYQWTVLAIASAGWVFDVFEGQIFVASMNLAAPELIGSGDTKSHKDLANAAFLLGGAIGGLFFGLLADHVGRRRAMVFTILMYSLFTGATYFAQNWYHLVALRFFAAMGVGGEWAVAAAVVAEVFPPRARALGSGIFHASSVLGTYLAILAGVTVVKVSWRYGFLLGVLPALLVLWIRASMRESEAWQAARRSAAGPAAGAGGTPALLTELLTTPWLGRLLLGTSLAAVGLATFWGAHIYGKDLLRQERAEYYLDQVPGAKENEQLRQQVLQERASDLQNHDMLGMLLVTTGGGLGLLSFAPLSQWSNRRIAFLIFHLGGLIVVLVTAQFVYSRWALLLILPLYGFLTLGMHAGYAVYFPELFPTRLRGTGGGFCFNIGRVLAGPIMLWGSSLGLSLRHSVSLLALLFLVGAVLLIFAPETKGQPLPE